MGLLKRLLGSSSSSVTATSLYGNDQLEVKGESFHQAELARIVQKLGREVPAILTPEPSNKFDSNAVGVWVGGLQVGYLTRDDAAIYQAAVIRLMKEEGQPIAVQGRIFGGERDKPSFGIWLYHDRALFGLAPHHPTGDTLRTGTSETQAQWMDGLPADRLSAIKYLRTSLTKETNPLDRHFIFNTLEDHLYASREVFESALHEFEETCEAHHAEMGTIRPALVAEFQGIPMLPLYRQMAIMKRKAHSYDEAMDWANRGLMIYGNECLREEDVADLRKRVEALRPKLQRGDGPIS